MSKPYNQYKVNELKVFLQERGLPTSGTKSELIGRLTESDSSSDKPVQDDAPVETEEKEETVAVDEKPVEAAPTESEPKTETVVEEEEDEIALPSAEPEKPQPTEEELFKSFSDDLKIRIKRTERFGGDSSELQARLKRLEKFGVSTILDANAKAAKTPAVKTNNGKKRGNRKNRNNNKNRPKPAVA